MNRRDRIRRQWTHRRLGLGAPAPSERAMARTDALLTTVGARRSSSGVAADAFELALFDYVRDVDLAAGVSGLDAKPIPLSALRAQAMTPPKPRFTWRLLVPATSGSLAAVAITLAVLVGGSTAPQTSTLSAAAESKQLLSHAGLLLTAAQGATTTERAKLVTEAKADLTHVARLLPLAPPDEQPSIRTQLQRLNRRARPLAPPPASSGGSAPKETNRSRSTSGATMQRSGSDSGTSTPVRQPGPTRQQPGAATTQTSATATGTRPVPPPAGSSGTQQTGTQQTGTQPPPPSGDGTQPRQTQSGPTYGGTTQPPPPGR